MRCHCVLCSVVLLVVQVWGSLSAYGQTAPLPLGSISTPVLQQQGCPSSFSTSTCYNATITCQGTAPITVIFGYALPQQPTPFGTIVFFGGGGGESPFSQPAVEQSYANDYLAAGYEIVEAAWASDWEQTSALGQPYTANIMTAACRPATFLNFVRFGTNPQLYQSGGMCALNRTSATRWQLPRAARFVAPGCCTCSLVEWLD